MSNAALREPTDWTVETFRAFYETRPDEERWELIDGVAVLVTPPLIAHQAIAGNLQALLNTALAVHDPTRFACQRIGVDLLPEIRTYHPEPDVSVIDAGYEAGQRYAGLFYLAGEIISDSDHEPVRQRGRTRIEAKRGIYREQPDCSCIILISQDEIRVDLDLRAEGGWRTSILRECDELLVLAEFGLSCRVRDLYRGTPLLR